MRGAPYVPLEAVWIARMRSINTASLEDGIHDGVIGEFLSDP
jgi:hypothetical protein